jgi:hypothetical protein
VLASDEPSSTYLYVVQIPAPALPRPSPLKSPRPHTTHLFRSSGLPAGAAPRVGPVIHIHPARDRRTALAELEVDVETVYAWGKDWLPAAETLEEKAAAINVHYGTPAEVTESIRAFPAFPFTTELQFSVAYGTTGRTQCLDAVEAIVTEIAPRLRWTPRRETVLA